MARARISSLNAQRSSIDPPPRPTIITSTPGTRVIALSARAMSSPAPSPWTRTGRTTRCAFGCRRLRTLMMSLSAAPSSEVTMPILRGRAGIGRLRAVAKRPSACSFRLQLLERELQRAAALRLEMLADELIFALRFVDRQPAARDDVNAVVDLEFQVAVGRAEHHRLELRGLILEREVDVAGVPHPAVRDFAFDPELAEARLERRRGCRRSAPRR